MAGQIRRELQEAMPERQALALSGLVAKELMYFSLGESMAAILLIMGKYDEVVRNKNNVQRGQE